jgi:transposase InsO family protein
VARGGSQVKVPARARKRRRGDGADGTRLRAQAPDEVWALDFQADQTADGRALRLVNVVDEFTREALVMRVARSITADQTVAALEGQNPFVESFHSRVRDELLNVEQFACLTEAEVLIADWHED